MTKIDRVIRLAQKTDQQAWDRVAGHPLQSWAWGQFRESTGLKVVRLVVSQGGQITSAWQLTFHPVPLLPLTIGYFPRGPFPATEMVNELRKIGKQQRAIFIQLEPNISKSSNLITADLNLLRPSHHPLFTKFTFVLDLTKPEEQLIKEMHHKTRYNIRLAQKYKVEVKEDNSDQAFHAYLRLTSQTIARQGFYAHSLFYHQKMWEVMHKARIARLWTATYQKQILAAWIIFVWKDTVYYPYGASSREHKEVMAPNLLLWEIVRWAKSEGFKFFDLWGALGPPPVGGHDPHDPWYGFNRFKQGYAPQLIELIGSYDLIINPLVYKLYAVSDTIRWIILKLKSKLLRPSW